MPAQDLLDAVAGGKTETVSNTPTGPNPANTTSPGGAELNAVTSAVSNDADVREALGESTKEPDEKTESEPKEKEPEEKTAPEPKEKEPEDKVKQTEEAEKAKKAAEAKQAADSKRDLEMAEKLGKLANQERQIRKEREEFKKEREAFQTERASMEAIKSAVALLETNPLKAMKLLGKDFKKVADRAIEVAKNPQLVVQDELELTKAELAKKQADFEKKLAEERAEEQKKQLSAREEQDKREAFAIITSKIESGAADKYELIKSEGLENQIAQDIWEHYQKTGEVVNVDSYCEHVENVLFEKATKRYLAAKKVKDYLEKSKPKPVAPPKPVVQDEDEEKDDEPIKKTVARVKRTLTNAVTPVEVVQKSEPVSTGNAFKDAVKEALDLMEAGKI